MNKFYTALRLFEESYAGISAFAGRPQIVDAPTDFERYSYSREKFNNLRIVWDKDILILERLAKLLEEYIVEYSAGNINQGDDVVMKLDEIVWAIRHKRL